MRERLDRRGLVLVLLLVVLAGCDGSLGGGGGRGGKAPAELATSASERASWPDAPKDAVAAKVQRVVDGDTFVAMVRSRRERVRVIGVDTPESVDPNRPDEPFGEEASDFAKHYLDGETVRRPRDQVLPSRLLGGVERLVREPA